VQLSDPHIGASWPDAEPAAALAAAIATVHRLRLDPDAVLVSGLTGEGLEQLVERIVAEFDRRLIEVELLLPYDAGRPLAELHELAGDLKREDTPEGVRVSVRLPASVAARYSRYALSGGAV